MNPVIAASILTVAFFSVGAAQAEASLVINTEEAAPRNFTKDGKIVGSSTDVLQLILEKSGVKAEIRMLPWQRAYGEALEQANTCVYSTSLTDERKPLFKWVTPLGVNQWTLLTTKERDLKVTSLEEAKKYKIGTYQGDAKEAFFLKQGGFTIDSIANNDLNEKKLVSGRIDLWAENVATVNAMIKKGNANLKPTFVFHEVEMALACNKNTPDDVIDKMNAALNELKKSGKIAEIERKYNE